MTSSCHHCYYTTNKKEKKSRVVVALLFLALLIISSYPSPAYSLPRSLYPLLSHFKRTGKKGIVYTPKDLHSKKKGDVVRVGSKPPTCQNKCNSCSPCYAVQVPTSPSHGLSTSGSVTYDGYPVYKPLGWKCKCRNRYFNP